MKMFGLGLATAIFVDATIVRMVLVPAIDEAARRRQLVAPGWLDRLLPRIEGEPARGAEDGELEEQLYAK